MTEQFFKYQLQEYIHNRLDLQDYEAFFAAIAEHDDAQIQEWISELMEKDEGKPDLRIEDPIIQEVHKRVLKNIYDIDPPHSNRFKRINYWAWASCAAILLCVFSWFYFSDNKKFEVENNRSTITWYENQQPYAIRTVLPDSSSVILYPNSKISFDSSKFGIRTIQQLAGRVVYNVQKNPQSPFQVHYKGYITTAIGTVFSVDPQDNNNVLIKLLEGKISVGPDGALKDERIFLQANEEVLIDLSSGKMMKSSVQDLAQKGLARADENLKKLNPELMANVEWTNQTVRFNQTKNLQLLQVIERLYDVSIVCENPSLLDNSFTGSLNRKEPMVTFFANFCQLNGCVFSIDNGIVNIQQPVRKEGPE